MVGRDWKVIMRLSLSTMVHVGFGLALLLLVASSATTFYSTTHFMRAVTEQWKSYEEL